MILQINHQQKNPAAVAAHDLIETLFTLLEKGILNRASLRGCAFISIDRREVSCSTQRPQRGRRSVELYRECSTRSAKRSP